MPLLVPLDVAHSAWQRQQALQRAAVEQQVDAFREVWTDPLNETRLIGRKMDGSTWWSKDAGQSWNPAINEKRLHHVAVNYGLKVLDHRPFHALYSKFTSSPFRSIKAKLQRLDPSWEEFKTLWAEEFGPIGDELPV